MQGNLTMSFLKATTIQNLKGKSAGGTHVILRGNFRREFQDANFKGNLKGYKTKYLKGNFEREFRRQFGWGNQGGPG